MGGACSGCRQVDDLPRGRYANLRIFKITGTRIRDHHISLFGPDYPAEIEVLRGWLNCTDNMWENFTHFVFAVFSPQLPALTDLNMDYCHVGNSAAKSLVCTTVTLDPLHVVLLLNRIDYTSTP